MERRACQPAQSVDCPRLGLVLPTRGRAVLFMTTFGESCAYGAQHCAHAPIVAATSSSSTSFPSATSSTTCARRGTPWVSRAPPLAPRRC